MEDNILRTSATTPATITTINGKQFVSGLFWQPLTRPRAFMKEAREIGKREGMDIVAIRRSTIMQAGFVAKNQGVMKGMYSLAASLAGTLGKSWIGVFALDEERFAFVAVQDGAILPGCDMVGTRDVILEKLRTTYSFFPKQWDKVYCPPSFEFGGDDLQIDKILTPSVLKKDYRLKQLTFGLTTKELVIGFVIITLLVGSSVTYFNWKRQRDKRALAERIQKDQQKRRDLEALNAKAKKAQTVKALEHPWSKAPAAEDFVVGCYAAIASMPLIVKGWGFESATCDGHHEIAIYKRFGNATVDEFVSDARRRWPTEPAILAGGNSAAINIELKLLFGGDDALPQSALSLSRLTSSMQAIGIEIKIDEKKDPQATAAKLPGQDAASAVTLPKPNWKTYSYSLSSDLSPLVFWQGVNGQGIRMSNLGATLKIEDTAPSITWNAAGEIYAQ